MKTKTVLILLGTAAAGGAIWYFHAKKIADASKAFVDYVQNGQSANIPAINPVATPKEVPQIIKTLVELKPLIIADQKSVPVYTAPVVSRPSYTTPVISQPVYTSRLIKPELYKSISLAGVFF